MIIRHEPTCCHRCGSDLAGATEVNCSCRQVFDIPPIKVHVTEHQIISRRSSCGQSTTADTPAQAAAPVQYGPVMCAVIMYLFMGCRKSDSFERVVGVSHLLVLVVQNPPKCRRPVYRRVKLNAPIRMDSRVTYAALKSDRITTTTCVAAPGAQGV